MTSNLMNLLLGILLTIVLGGVIALAVASISLMAKRSCPHCRTMVSRKATICPHCGVDALPVS